MRLNPGLSFAQDGDPNPSPCCGVGSVTLLIALITSSVPGIFSEFLGYMRRWTQCHLAGFSLPGPSSGNSGKWSLTLQEVSTKTGSEMFPLTKQHLPGPMKSFLEDILSIKKL